MLKKISRWLWHPIWTLLKLLLRRPLLATSVIPLLPDGRLVLIRRRDNGLWGLPGGLVDWGENIEAAAKRELVEETGLVLVSVERLVGVYSGVKRDERFHNTCVAIEAKVEGTMSIADPDEVLDIKAFHKNELPTERLAHDHNQQLDDYFAGRTVIA